MNKPIFGSLGSNYDLYFAVTALVTWLFPRRDARAQLQAQLEKQFGGAAALTYKGRDGIELALRALGVGPGDAVLTQAFACFAVEEGILRSGAAPVYVDISPQALSPGIRELEAALTRAPRAKAVILQHTLGYPFEYSVVQAWCKKNDLLIIDDLAQAYGSVADTGELIGSKSDAVILSFGRDKILDAVSGGAVIVKNTAAIQQLRVLSADLPNPERSAVLKDALYPSITWKSRAFYSLLIGKVIVAVAKKLGLISSPLSAPKNVPTSISNLSAVLALHQLLQVEKQLKHRRMIANVYHLGLQSKDQSARVVNQSQITEGACLRYPVALLQLEKVIALLKKESIFISDRWYRSAVDCSTLSCTSVYRSGTCPVAENRALSVINLPTHRGISKKSAERIIETLLKTVQVTVPNQ